MYTKHSVGVGLEIIVQPFLTAGMNAVARQRKALAFLIESWICHFAEAIDEAERPQQSCIDCDLGCDLAFLSIRDGAPAGADLGGDRIDGQVSAQASGPQIGPELLHGLFDFVGCRLDKGILGGHVLLRAPNPGFGALESI
jgi:hypothetical protein